MLKIKLSPTGKKHAINYRIVILEDKSKLTGTPKATIGYFDPAKNRLEFDQKMLEDWISKGAQPTDRVRSLLKL